MNKETPSKLTEHESVEVDKGTHLEEKKTKSIMNKGGTGAVVSTTPEASRKRDVQVVFQEPTEVTSLISNKDINKQTSRSSTTPGDIERTVTGCKVVPTDSEKKDHPHFIVQDKFHLNENPSKSNTQQTSQGFSDLSTIKEEISNDTQGLGPNAPVPETTKVIPKNVERTFLLPKNENSKNIDLRLPTDDGKIHILIGCCGTPGVKKLKPMIKKFKDIYGDDRLSVHVILTFSARRLYSKKLQQHQSINTSQLKTILDLPSDIHVWNDVDEWDAWKQRNDPVLHIELRRWADILLIAPLSANTLAKISLGLCDNLLTCVVRAWNPNYSIFVAPSMISSVYNSAMTKKQIKILKDEMPWITVLRPSEKYIGVHGDIGLGGMMDINEIVDKVVTELGGYEEGEKIDTEENEDEEDNGDEYEDRNIVEDQTTVDDSDSDSDTDVSQEEEE